MNHSLLSILENDQQSYFQKIQGAENRANDNDNSPLYSRRRETSVGCGAILVTKLDIWWNLLKLFPLAVSRPNFQLPPTPRLASTSTTTHLSATQRITTSHLVAGSRNSKSRMCVDCATQKLQAQPFLQLSSFAVGLVRSIIST
jgi:hypothetical protein